MEETTEQLVERLLAQLKGMDIPTGTEGFVPNNPNEPSYCYWGDFGHGHRPYIETRRDKDGQ